MEEPSHSFVFALLCGLTDQAHALSTTRIANPASGGPMTFNDTSGGEWSFAERAAQRSVMATDRIARCDWVVIWPRSVNQAAAQQLTIREPYLRKRGTSSSATDIGDDIEFQDR